MLLKGFSISDGAFGGILPKIPPNGKLASNSTFSGGNRPPLKTNFVVVIDLSE